MIALLATIGVLAVALLAFTGLMARRIERRYPPLGARIDIGGYRLHAVHFPAPPTADLPPLVFIHGASGNLRDPMGAFAAPLAERAEMLFVDRPGHGHSDRGPEANGRPDGQAAAIAALMDRIGMKRAIIVGHSFGGVIAANFAIRHPDMTAGLVFLAPATHPWPGGVAWYNGLARMPVVGALFARLLALPAGLALIQPGMRSVFSPNPVPDDYEATGAALVLRPRSFRANATDLANLFEHVRATADRYRLIKAPTVIVTGDSDGVVLPDLHARGLYRDIEGSRLVWIRNLGHKPDYVTTDVSIAAIETVAGHPSDRLTEIARRAEARLACDRRAPAPATRKA